MSDDNPPGVIRVATGGIQDVAALLPLLGTDQCEIHVTSALQRGYLYAAAAPMSIFGSLGLVKAGVATLWASIDTLRFSGPASLRNAGFRHLGAGKLLAPVDENRPMSVVEEKVHRMLCRKAISGLGLCPYALLIYRLPAKSFKQTWLYPIIRIVGCDLVAICIQIIFQIRILELAYCRIRFLATDRYLKRVGYTGFPESWDSNQRSTYVLDQFHRHVYEEVPELPRESLTPVFKDLGKMSSLDLISGARNSDLPDGTDLTELNITEGGYTQRLEHPPFTPETLAPRSKSIPPITIFLRLSQAILFASICAAVIGYIGCFTVIQSSPKSDPVGPAIWLVLEVFLSLLRTGLWAWNPTSDDATPPIALRKITSLPVTAATGAGPFPRAEKEDVSGTVKWDLDSVTKDDLLAVVIGVSEYENRPCSLKNIPNCVEAAQAFESYLKNCLGVPSDQVVTLLDADATKDRILNEIKQLALKIPPVPNTPVIIYIAAYSLVGSDLRGAVIPHLPDGKFIRNKDLNDFTLSYQTLIDLLGTIGRERTDNITVIMDCCFAGHAREVFDEDFQDLYDKRRELPGASGMVIDAPCIVDETSLFSGVWTNGTVRRQIAQGGVKEVRVDGYPGGILQVVGIKYELVDSPSYFLITTSRARLVEDAGPAQDPSPAEGAHPTEDTHPAEDPPRTEDPSRAEDPSSTEDVTPAEDPSPTRSLGSVEDAPRLEASFPEEALPRAEDTPHAQDTPRAEDPPPAKDMSYAEEPSPAENIDSVEHAPHTGNLTHRDGATRDSPSLREDPEAGRVGWLTESLLDTLSKSESLETMTYAKLMSEVTAKMNSRSESPDRLAQTNAANADWARQHPIWTKTFHNRLLFDGLFARSLDSSSPVITVRYEG